MAIIIETCPKCGHDLQDLVIATYPPIPQKQCLNCDWSWTGEPEQVLRMPFDEDGLDFQYETHTYLGFDSVIITGTVSAESLMGNFEQSACNNCSNNFKNGGSGICNCTLGQINVT